MELASAQKGGRYGHKIGKEPFKEHSHKVYYYYFISFQILWPLGKGFYNMILQLLGGHVGGLGSSAEAGQPAPAVMGPEDASKRWLVAPGPAGCSDFVAKPIVSFSWFVEGA